MPITRGLSASLFLLGAVVLAGAAAAVPALPAGGESEGEALFRGQVFPILKQSCFPCHGPRAARLRGGLLMNGSAAVLRGGDSGPALVPGDAEASLLVRAVRRTDPDLEMPPKKALPAESVALIERWVALGAPWPEDLVAAREAPAAAAPGKRPDARPAADEEPMPAPTDHESMMFFENEVRPLLAQHCYECHGPDLADVESGLRFSGRAALLRGGDRGPTLLPGHPDESLLVNAVRWADADLSMPPDDKLKPQEIAILEAWVARGAPWPGGDESAPEPEDAAAEGPDIEAGRSWWSFRPVVRSEVPAVAAGAEVRNPIDAFIEAQLAAQGLRANPPAGKAELARRAWFDLIGLPPTLQEVQAFVDDEAPDAWPRLVDRLLAMPEYGERWGRYWLDVVRWAQTNGYERDTEKPFAWRYRNWVIDAFNADKPYDRFLVEQLAGDELPSPDDGALIATGFYRVGVWDDEPDDVEQAGFDEYDDLVRTIGEGVMGVTLGCARCHDHKFDPIGQEDYYSTVALLRNVRHYSEPRFGYDSPTLRPLGFNRETAMAWERERNQRIAEDRAAMDALLERARGLAAEQGSKAARPEELAELLPFEERKQYAQLSVAIDKTRKSFEGSLDWALAVAEAGGPPPDTHLLVRGRASSPAQVVPPRFVRVLAASDAQALPQLREAGAKGGPTTGRRLALASWITAPEHPTTARVLVNRVWQHHFGRGLVATPDDFGRTGTPPTHPELLDWLASEFVRNGWSIKQLHRLIMDSAAYRRSSLAEDPTALRVDPADTLLWRQNLRRIDAEAVRDSVLAVAGTLSREREERGYFPRLSREALAGGSRPGQGWELPASEPAEPRSIYVYVKRSLIPPLLEVFDYTNTSLPVGLRPVTTLASQALMLLNSEFMGVQSAAFADRVLREAGDDPEAQVTRAFELAFARRPDAAELALARDLLARETAAFADAPSDLVFRSRVPSRLDIAFHPQLTGADMLFGPRAGWTYHKGRLGNLYNSTEEVDLAAGPSALLDTPAFGDVDVRARVWLSTGCEIAAFVLHAEPDGELFRGVEAVLDPRAGEVRLVAHADGQEIVLARAPATLVRETWHTVAVSVRGSEWTVRLDDAPEALLSATAPDAPATGRFGVRAWGDALRLADLTLTADGASLAPGPDDPGSPSLRALRSFCLMLCNLNEFVYVD